MVGGFRWLSAADEDEIWRRMRAGHSMKPTARALGLPASTVRSYLVAGHGHDVTISTWTSGGTGSVPRVVYTDSHRWFLDGRAFFTDNVDMTLDGQVTALLRTPPRG